MIREQIIWNAGEPASRGTQSTLVFSEQEDFSPPQTTLHGSCLISNTGTGVEDEPASEFSSAPWQRHALLLIHQFAADCGIKQI